ncbi:MAG: endolytic transglycosylase MltG [Gammaproteobacteria bacterium]
MRRVLRTGALALLVIVLAALAAAVFVQRESVRAMQATLPLDAPELVRVRPGSSTADVARDLEQRGWVPHYRLFVLRARLDGVAGRLQAGTYEAAPGDTLADLLAAMVAGRTKTFSVTFVEGSRFMEAVAVLAADDHVRSTLDGLEPAAIMAALGLEPRHPEGLFFPSTYRFDDGDSDADILRRAYARMQRELDEAWGQRDQALPYDTPYEALIMASIVEKETGRADERKAIAGVFVRRLGRGMKLQTDPTVIYGLGSAFDGNLRRADLRRDTPYNTYTRRGLPPTPIALPGAAAIEAALHPADGKALYFVAKGDGSHYFSESLREHNNAVRRYQLKR